MGTTTWETDKAPAQIIREAFAPYAVRMWTTDEEAAAVCVVVPVTDENRAGLREVYDIPEYARHAHMAFIVKHEGTLARSNNEVRRTVSVKIMGETVGPAFTGGANRQFMDTLTPLRAKPDTDSGPLAYAHSWRDRARRALHCAA